MLKKLLASRSQSIPIPGSHKLRPAERDYEPISKSAHARLGGFSTKLETGVQMDDDRVDLSHMKLFLSAGVDPDLLNEYSDTGFFVPEKPHIYKGGSQSDTE